MRDTLVQMEVVFGCYTAYGSRLLHPRNQTRINDPKLNFSQPRNRSTVQYRRRVLSFALLNSAIHRIHNIKREVVEGSVVVHAHFLHWLSDRIGSHDRGSGLTEKDAHFL